MKNLWHERACCAALAALLPWIPAAGAQTYPSQTIRLIVPQSAGSVADTVARIMGQQLSTLLGQQIIVDNRAGAGGLVGAELAAKAPADGYTLLIATISTHGTIPALHSKLPFDPVKDFAAVTMFTTVPNVLTVHPSLPVRSTGELIALARARPGQINIGSQGIGSSQHLATELFSIMAGGLKMVHVPYKGSGASLTGIITGEVSVLMPTLALSLPHIEARKIRALAVTTMKRIDELPDLPTIDDALPGFEVLSWLGLVAPAKVPRSVISRLSEASSKVLAMPEVRKTFSAAGMTTAQMSPEQFGSFIEAEIAKWSKVAKTANIRAD